MSLTALKAQKYVIKLSIRPLQYNFFLNIIRLKKCLTKLLMIFLPALKLVSGWFVTKKNYKRLHSNLFLDDGILFFDDDSGNVTFSTDEMGNLSVGLNNIKLCYDNFDKGDQ